MILSGEPIPARQALEYGAIDAILEGELTPAAVEFARLVVREKRPLRRVAAPPPKSTPLRGKHAHIHHTAPRLCKRTRRRHAPAARDRGGGRVVRARAARVA